MKNYFRILVNQFHFSEGQCLHGAIAEDVIQAVKVLAKRNGLKFPDAPDDIGIDKLVFEFPLEYPEMNGHILRRFEFLVLAAIMFRLNLHVQVCGPDRGRLTKLEEDLGAAAGSGMCMQMKLDGNCLDVSLYDIRVTPDAAFRKVMEIAQMAREVPVSV